MTPRPQPGLVAFGVSRELLRALMRWPAPREVLEVHIERVTIGAHGLARSWRNGGLA